MDKREFMEGIHVLQNNYGKTLTAEQLKLYFENLKDMNKDEFIKNIEEQIKTNPFMPNIAQLRSSFTQVRNKYSNYKQREYTELDFEKLYANGGK